MGGITIVIPTYWCRARGHAGRPEDAIFDHPTPIDESGTLGRCLESLKTLRTHDFRVLLITAPVNSQLTSEVERRVEELIEPFRTAYPIGQFAPSDLERLRGSLSRSGLNPGLVSLEAYAQVRNCQILGSVLLESDLIVAIDDDEIVPPDYLERAVRSMDELERRGGNSGLAGIYLDAAGDYRLKVTEEEAASKNRFVRKALLINEQFDACFSAAEELVETPLALGGNMVFPPKLFRNVSFDPGITRGEDIDYLMNSRLFGFSWFLDVGLSITHLPPKASTGDPVTTTPYAKLQRDVLRFVYQRQKIRISQQHPDLHPLRYEDFGIYPGEFLKEDLDNQALEALRILRPVDADERFFPEAEQMLQTARERAMRAEEYPAFNTSWKKVLEVVDGDQDLKEEMRRKFGV
ncbi:MAG: glycosyltransferase family 2 protein [Spirochaetaceae bacterium]|nr:MAG: glycosyltransferase family 2 protein [Spirochaetaceae bacterium]